MRPLTTPFAILFLFVFSNDVFARTSLDSAVRKISTIRNDSLRLDAMFSYNRYLWEQEPDQSSRLVGIALEDALKTKQRFFVAKSYSALGYNYLQATDYPRALDYFLKSLKLWREIGDFTRQAETLLFLSDIHSKNGDLEKAASYAQQAIVLCRTKGASKLEPKALNQLAIVFEQRAQPLEAIALYKQGIEAAKREKDLFFETFLLGNMGTSFKTLNQNDKALAAFAEATRLGDSLQEPYIQAVGRFNMAEMHFLSGNITESKRYAQEALDRASRVNETETIIGANRLLKEIALKAGDHRLAMEYFKKEVGLKDSVFNSEKSAQIAEMQTRFDTQLKDAEIETQRRQLTRNRIMNLLLLGGIVFVGLIGFIIWRLQRRTSRLHEQVSAQKKELEQLNQVKDRIFSVISHDMRTPVNSLLAFMQLMEEQDLPREKLALYGRELRKSMTGTAALLDNLLNWARTQMHGYKPVAEAFDITGTLQSTSELLMPEAQHKNIGITVPRDMEIYVFADVQMTAIVLRNLLHNAIKYSKPGSEVVVSTVSHQDIIQLSISDRGPGFARDMVDAFNRDDIYKAIASTPGTANEKGTGLGLILTRTFMKLMGGSVYLESTETFGSTFVMTFPAAKEEETRLFTGEGSGSQILAERSYQ